MKTQILIISVAMLGISFGCNTSVEKENKETTIVQPQVSELESEHEHSLNESIELNNGSKWTVVPKMMQYIRNMESDVNHFGESQNTELKDFKQLGASLQKNIDLLTSSCTMEGKAHDELHKWLVPYIDLVGKLNASKNSEEALHTFEEIKSSLKTFNKYFE